MFQSINSIHSDGVADPTPTLTPSILPSSIHDVAVEEHSLKATPVAHSLHAWEVGSADITMKVVDKMPRRHLLTTKWRNSPPKLGSWRCTTEIVADLVAHATVIILQSLSLTESKLTWSQFPTIWLTWDIHKLQYDTVNTQNSAQDSSEVTIDVIRIFKQVAIGNSEDNKVVVGLLDHYNNSEPIGQHHFMVFELLDDNLFTFIKDTDCLSERNLLLYFCGFGLFYEM